MTLLYAPDRVIVIPAEVADFKRRRDLRKVVIRGDGKVSISGNADFAKLTEKQQARLLNVLTYVSRFVARGPTGERDPDDEPHRTELSFNLKIVPVALGKPSTEYVKETNTVHVQVIHLTDVFPLSYSHLIAHHDLIEHVYRGYRERRAVKGTQALLQVDADAKDALRFVVLRAKPFVEPRRVLKKLITRDINFQKTEIKFIIHDLRVCADFDWFIAMHEKVGALMPIYMPDVEAVCENIRVARRARKEYERAVKALRSDEKIVVLGMRYIESIDEAIQTIVASKLTKPISLVGALNSDGTMMVDMQELGNRLKWIKGIHIRIAMFNMQFEAGETAREQFRVCDVFEYYIAKRLQPYVSERTAQAVELKAGRMEDGIVQGNAARFIRVIFNLVMNAVDAMDDHGGSITVSVENSKQNLVVYVADTGRGMPEEKIQQLLTPRRNLDGELHSLGFEFVKRTIAGMGGVLNIDSAPGSGTTIKITLPRSEDENLVMLEFPKVENFMVGDIATATQRRTSCGDDCRDDRGPDHDGASENEAEDDGEPDERYGESILASYRQSPRGFRGTTLVISANLENLEGEIEYFTQRAYENDSEVPHEILDPYFYKVGIRGRYTDYYEGFKKYGTALILKTPFASDIDEYFEFHLLDDDLKKPTYLRGMLHDELILVARALVNTGLPGDTSTHLEVELENMFGVYGQMPKDEVFLLEELAGVETLLEMEKKYDWVPG